MKTTEPRKGFVVDKLAILKNPLKPYAWGSDSAIPELLGIPVIPGHPVAEMWIGAHRLGSSELRQGNAWVSLLQLIFEQPERYLGQRVFSRYGGELPFLMKVLAASRPLSIQAHPDRHQAISGFQSENARGMAVDDPRRTYKDPNPKPECVCALTPFWAMCGFRSIDAVLANVEPFSALLHEEWNALVHAADEASGLRMLFRTLLELDPHRKEMVLTALRQQVESRALPASISEWIGKLLMAYPSDIGCLAPLFLNVICLEPGQALFLPPNTLHAYLEGTAIEIMANSDNVVRGGLTPKHIDIETLASIVNFSPSRVSPLQAQALDTFESIYPAPAAEFRLSRIDLDGATSVDLSCTGGIEIFLCTRGSLAARTESAGASNLVIGKGTSFLVMPDCSAIRLKGSGRLFRAVVP
ncbi:mannose-6-phosphate isomerase, class I [Desulfatirhabdium butyrativorans]|uniref:mannose-6-phosphate isomerase, class I n=1 Tax=Desulfatirhabdium butyrativorans TaxID=340467 RepID=UPI00068727FD|nr:mannose-6-phosphate isomerase, class I [Desulfatirhabdium butyrativorans]